MILGYDWALSLLNGYCNGYINDIMVKRIINDPRTMGNHRNNSNNSNNSAFFERFS